MRTRNVVAFVLTSAIVYDAAREEAISRSLAQPLQPHTELALNYPAGFATTSAFSITGAQAGFKLHILPKYTRIEDRLPYLIVDLVAIGPDGHCLVWKERVFERVQDFLHAEIMPEFSKPGNFSRKLLNSGSASFAGDEADFLFTEEQLRRLGTV